MTAARRLFIVLAAAVLAPACRGGGGPSVPPLNVVAHRSAQPIQPPPGAIHPADGAFAAPIACFSLADKHDAFGGAAAYAPTSDELELADAQGGKLRRFVYTRAAAGSCADARTLNASPTAAAIYWSPGSCAHVVRGPVLATWERQGGARGSLGYPITDELSLPEGGVRQLFEGGEAAWTTTGVTFKRRDAPAR